MMNHSFVIVPEGTDTTQSSTENSRRYYPHSTSPRLLDMQLKSLISEIGLQSMRATLERLHSIFRTAKPQAKASKRTSCLVLMIGIAIIIEEGQHQMFIRTYEQERDCEQGAVDSTSWQKARRVCLNMDDSFDFIRRLFHRKYSSPKRWIFQLSSWVTSEGTFSRPEQGFLSEIRRISEEHSMLQLCRECLHHLLFTD